MLLLETSNTASALWNAGQTSIIDYLSIIWYVYQLPMICVTGTANRY